VRQKYVIFRAGTKELLAPTLPAGHPERSEGSGGRAHPPPAQILRIWTPLSSPGKIWGGGLDVGRASPPGSRWIWGGRGGSWSLRRPSVGGWGKPSLPGGSKRVSGTVAAAE